MSLEPLLRAVRDNQPGAWQALVPPLQSKLYHYCLARLPPDDAQEIAQRTIVLVLDLLPGLEGVRSLERWTFGVARNLMHHELRGHARRAARHEAAARQVLASLRTGLSTRFDRAEIWRIVCEEIERLPPHLRAALEHDLAEGDAEAFASQHRISPVTLRTHRHRARQLLAQRVKARLQTPR